LRTAIYSVYLTSPYMLPQQICSFAWGSGPPLNIYVLSWAHQNPHPKQHLDWFIRFCRDSPSLYQTDTHADHGTSVTTDRILCFAKRCGVIIRCMSDDFLLQNVLITDRLSVEGSAISCVRLPTCPFVSTPSFEPTDF